MLFCPSNLHLPLCPPKFLAPFASFDRSFRPTVKATLSTSNLPILQGVLFLFFLVHPGSLLGNPAQPYHFELRTRVELVHCNTWQAHFPLLPPSSSQLVPAMDVPPPRFSLLTCLRTLARYFAGWGVLCPLTYRVLDYIANVPGLNLFGIDR